MSETACACVRGQSVEIRRIYASKSRTIRGEELVPVHAFAEKLDIEASVQRFRHAYEMVFLDTPSTFLVGFEQLEPDQQLHHLLRAYHQSCTQEYNVRYKQCTLDAIYLQAYPICSQGSPPMHAELLAG